MFYTCYYGNHLPLLHVYLHYILLPSFFLQFNHLLKLLFVVIASLSSLLTTPLIQGIILLAICRYLLFCHRDWFRISELIS